MDSSQIRQKYLDFFKSKNHAVIPPASLVPVGDPTTLFNGSGMQQLVPYLKGEEHPMGKRIVDVQPCFRAEDIEEVGDNRHTTFFEMLGNWSLGDYFKKEQLAWFWEFLTGEIGLSKQKLHVTVFEGNKEIPKDEDSVRIWEKLGVTGTRIHFYSADKNWWSRAGAPENMPAGEIGGPDSEVFYDFGDEHKLHEKSPFNNKKCHVNCDCGRFLEIGNSVFMEYEKQEDGAFKPLPSKNVDFGGGLERIAAALNNDPDVFKTDLFTPIVKKIEEISGVKYEQDADKKAFRVIADHIKGAVMLAASGVEPSNKEQGYFSRRLIRRSIRYGKTIGINKAFIEKLVGPTIDIYADFYPEVKKQGEAIAEIVKNEESKFWHTLDRGLKEFEKLALKNKISGKDAFYLYETYGFPFEITLELAKEKGLSIDEDKFRKEKQSHQQLSRQKSGKRFKSGLADQSEEITKLHTATHLLHQALRKILGDHVCQEGSNITAERLRFDFSHPQALTEEEIKKVEKLVNQKIKQNLSVAKTIENRDQALESGALAFFREKYPEKVSIYSIGEKDCFSKELCAGPHVSSTGEIGGVRIKKQEAIGSGKRRIYAELSIK